MSRIPEPAELREDIEDLRNAWSTDIKAVRGDLREISDKLERIYLPREVYDARHGALRNEVALELAAMRVEIETTKSVASNARSVAMWALGILTTAAIVALVGFISNNGGGL